MKPSPLTGHIGYWLRQLSNHVSDSFAERLARYDVSVPQWVVLRVLFDHDALALKDIVTRVGVDQGSLSRMVDRLLARDLVTRVEDTTDRRAVAISLTAKARKLVPKLAADADENDSAFFATLTKAQRKEFLAIIHQLLAANSSASRGLPLK